MKKTIIIIVSVVVIVGIAISIFFFYKNNKIPNLKLSNKDDVIVVVFPLKDSIISSPLTVSGRARGTWFFEGSFPIILVDSDRNTIAEGHTTAKGDWMTNEFVKFAGSLEFNNFIKGDKGTLILKKDNPSGLPENDDSIEIPVVFK